MNVQLYQYLSRPCAGWASQIIVNLSGRLSHSTSLILEYCVFLTKQKPCSFRFFSFLECNIFAFFVRYQFLAVLRIGHLHSIWSSTVY